MVGAVHPYFEWDPPGEVIGHWIALDPATVENGCVRIIPRSHREGPRPHDHRRDFQLADERVPVPRARVVPLRPGGVLFFSALLHHGTPPNLGPDRRRAVQFHYVAAHCRKIDLEQHREVFHDGDLYAGCRKPPSGSLVDPAPYPTAPDDRPDPHRF